MMQAQCDSSSSFSIGDTAVYPAHGVAEIQAIEVREIAGVPREFYVLRVVQSDMKLMVPVDGAGRVGMRAVVSDDVAAKVFEVLRAAEVAVAPGPWNRRFREYTELVNSGSLVEIAKVFRDLLRIRPDRDLSFGERRLLEQSRQLLVSELAIACKSAPGSVESDLEVAVDG